MSTTNEKHPQFSVEVLFGTDPDINPIQDGEVEVEIPFCGLYQSILCQICDNESDRTEENALDEWLDASDEDKKEIEECYRNLQLRLDMKDIYNQWIDFIENIVREETGVDASMRLAGCWSPSEYNFHSDQLTVYIKKETLRKLVDWAFNNDACKERLDTLVTRYTTPSSGYVPYYDKEDFDGWPTDLKPCQHCLLFVAITYVAGYESIGDMEVAFYDACEPTFYEAENE